MNIEKYKKFLLSHIPTAKPASGGTVINCRCMNCPDSRDPRSAHFYISIPQNDNEPSLYYCHKCHCAGIVTYLKLIEWGIYEEDIALELTNHNKKCSLQSVNEKYFNRFVYRIVNTITTIDKTSEIKLNLINKRLGCNFSYEELRKLKIVLNLNDLLRCNNITELTRDNRIVSELDSNFIGFISIDNAFLNMRRMCDEGKVSKSIDKRYINYKIYDKFDTSERFYTIPTEIDLTRPERVKIHVAEGPFDILSIYKNVRNEEPGIYTSVGGSNYMGIIIYFLFVYKLPYVEFHIYPDNDKYGSNYNMNKIAQILKPLQAPFYVHRNLCNGQKDFGVSKEYISEYIQKIY